LEVRLRRRMEWIDNVVLILTAKRLEAWTVVSMMLMGKWTYKWKGSQNLFPRLPNL